MIAVALRQEVLLDLNLLLLLLLLLVLEFGARARRRRPLGYVRRDLLVLLVVVVEATVLRRAAEEIVAGRVGGGQSDGIGARRERQSEIGAVRRAVVRRVRRVAGIGGRIGGVLLLVIGLAAS